MKSTASGDRDGNGSGFGGNGGNREEGQLRYWTAEMCRDQAHLFDFVITVSRISIAHRTG